MPGSSSETHGIFASPIIGREAPHHLSLGTIASMILSPGIPRECFAGEYRGEAGSREDNFRFPVPYAPGPQVSETPCSPPPRPVVV